MDGTAADNVQRRLDEGRHRGDEEFQDAATVKKETFSL
jgi:hypothetical protein